MRLVIDLQGAQSDSRGRGIGRYSRALALAMAAEAGRHEVVIVLNAGFREAAAELRDAFAPLLPARQIRAWQGPGRQTALRAEDAPRRRAAERIRAAFLADQQPDLLLVTSVFEGFGDDAVTSLPADVRGPPCVSVCYDLIPLLRPDIHLADPVMRLWYHRALLQLRQSEGLLAISQSSQQEIVDGLGLARESVANIMAGVGAEFRPATQGDEQQAAVLARYGLQSGYVLCVGAIEQRKNLAGLIRAYAMLPPAVRQAHPLVATGWNDPHQLPPLRQVAADAGLGTDELRLLTRFVPDADLPALYRGSAVTVSPSLHEGFGLSVAEAMACGAAVLCSNVTSLPEVIGRADATFDPLDPESIAGRLGAVLGQPAFRDALRRHGLARAPLFTWPRTAQRAWEAIERFAPERRAPARETFKRSLAVLTPLAGDVPPLVALLVRLARDYAVMLVSDDAPPDDPALASFAFVRCADLLDARPSRLLYLPQDSPHHMAETIRLSGASGGIVVTGARSVTSVLADAMAAGDTQAFEEALLEFYGWRAMTALRAAEPGFAERFPLEPLLAARSVAVIEEGGLALASSQIERFYAASPRAHAEACAAGLAADGAAGPDVARAFAASFREARPRTLFLDASTLAAFDAGTGIQRVVREIVRQLGSGGEAGARVEPVCTHQGQVTLARRFAATLFGSPKAASGGLPALFAPGDVFVCLDLNVHDIAGLDASLQAARAGGARTVVVIYDLLPVLQPQHFPEPVQRAFPLWLRTISASADALLCISQTVAGELEGWLARNPPLRTRKLYVGWFHLGADFAAAAPRQPVPGRPTLLMVGTVEPRKGHTEALDALESLWRKHVDIGLVIAGKGGWHTEALQARLRTHAEAGGRLQWIPAVDDGRLSGLYRSSAALLMASEGEGFGLPIVEAAHAGLSVIARDLPVFREIGGESAVYFEAGHLAPAIQRWLALRSAGALPDVSGIATTSWAAASRRLADIVLEDEWPMAWEPPSLMTDVPQ